MLSSSRTVVAVVVIVVVGFTPMGTALHSPDAQEAACEHVGSPALPCHEWIDQYAGPGDWYDRPRETVTSPDGSLVHVVGSSPGEETNRDLTVLTYEADTGELAWVHRYDRGAGAEEPRDVAVASDGTLYIAGFSENPAGSEDYLVLALDGATGEEVWAHHHNGPWEGQTLAFHDLAWALALSPDEQRVFVTGTLRVGEDAHQVETLGLEATSGDLAWVQRLAIPGDGFGRAIDVAPDGGHVYVGADVDTGSEGAQALVAYDAQTGALAWKKVLDGDPGRSFVGSVVSLPDSSGVLLVGDRQNTAEDEGLRFRVSRHDADTGSQAWITEGPWGSQNGAVLSPDGETLYVSGALSDTDEGALLIDATVIAYDVATGGQDWVSVYRGPYEVNLAGDLGVSPDGSRVYTATVSGSLALQDTTVVTVGFATSDGEAEWARRFAGTNANYNNGLPQDTRPTLATGPSGDAVFVSLASDTDQNMFGASDIFTLRYGT